MEKTLLYHINRLKNEIAGISRNVVIDLFEESRCQMIDERGQTDPFIKSQQEQIIKLLEVTGPDHSAKLENAFGLYNEIQVFRHLQQKCTINPVNRSQSNTPDFKITGKDNTQINLELKTLFAADSEKTIRNIQEQFHDMSAKTEAIQKGILLAHADVSVSYNFFKTKGQQTVQRQDMIELLYGKLDKSNTIKQLTYQGNPGILMVDFAVYDYIFCPQEALPYFIYPSYHSAMVSGLFWHLCFGRKGERLMEMPAEMDMGRPCLGTEMQRDGLLYKHPEIKAMIIAIKYGDDRRLVGLHKAQMEDPAVLHTLYGICEFVNNDLNTEYFRLGYDPRIKYWPDDPDRSNLANVSL